MKGHRTVLSASRRRNHIIQIASRRRLALFHRRRRRPIAERNQYYGTGF